MSYNSLFGLGTHSPDADLVGLWNCQDNAASTTLTDDSGLGRDGVCTANTSTMSTTGPTAWLPLGIDWFTSASNYATVAYDAAMNSSALSVGGWMWRNSSTQAMASRYLTTGNQRSWWVEVSSGSLPSRVVTDGTAGTATAVTPGITTDSFQQWTNLAFVSDGANAFGYVNGSSSASVASAVPYSGTADLAIAKQYLTSGPNGSLKMAGFWMFTRDLAVTELDEARLGPEPLNLTAPVLSQSTYTISTTDGTWDSQANGVVYYSYSWEYADDASGTNPVALNSTGSEIDATPEMDGKFIRVTVSASNDGGNDSAEDHATAWTAVTATSRGLGKEKAWWCPSLQDDSSNAIVGDLTVNGYDMNTVNMGSSNWVADTSEGGVRALEFNGTDEYCQTDLNNVPYSSLDAQLQTSVSVWVYGELVSGNGNPWAYAKTQGGISSRRVGYRLADRGADEAAQCVFASQDGSSNAQVAIKTTNGSQPRSTWYHVYAEFEKSAVGNNQNGSTRLWIDGVYIGEDSNTDGIFNNEPLHKMFLGQNTRTAGNLETTYFDGRLDDIRFFGEHLTQNEITHLASARGVEGSPGGGGPTFQPAWAFQATVVAL